MIISIAVEKAFDKIQPLFMTKILSKLGMEVNDHNWIKSIYKKSMTHIILHGKTLKTFPVSSEIRQRYLSPLSVNIVLGVLATGIKQEEEEKGVNIEKKKLSICR